MAPQLQEAANQQKAFSQFNSVGFGGGTGAWVRDGDLILNVARQSGSRQFVGMQVFELSPQHTLVAIGHAASAHRDRASHVAARRLHGVALHADGRDHAARRDEKLLQSNVTAGFLGLAVQDPEQLTLAALWQLIGYFHANSLDARQYLFAFWSKIARTVAIAFSVLLAIPFVLGSMRSAGAGTRTMLGLGIGIAFFLLQRLIESGTIVFQPRSGDTRVAAHSTARDGHLAAAGQSAVGRPAARRGRPCYLARCACAAGAFFAGRGCSRPSIGWKISS